MSVLKQGSKGEDVKALQQNLSKLGLTVDVDGAFGPNTEKAVRLLQTMFGYNVDGIAGAGTLSLIDSQVAAGWNAQNPGARLKAFNAQTDASKQLSGNLKRGSKGQDVFFLQNRLALLGFDVALDGDFGDGTEKAVRELQGMFGYTVDGIVGQGTNKLFNQQIGLGWNRALPNAAELATAAQGGGQSANV